MAGLGTTVGLIKALGAKISPQDIQNAADSWLEENITNPDSPPLDRSLSSSSAAAPADIVGNLKNTIAPIKESDKTGVDLDVSDPSGNVILRLANGHIQTKEFDSSEVVTDLEGVKDDLDTLSDTVGEKISEPETTGTSGQVLGLDSELNPVWVDQTGGNNNIAVKESTETGTDLDISDPYGNVILRLKNGGIKTLCFDSENVKNTVEEYSVSVTYDSSKTNTMTISHPFKKGDEIYFHLEDGYKYHDYGRYATYYEGNKSVTGNRRGSNGYYRHVITADCESVGVTIASGEYTNGTELTLFVYKINGKVEPKIITVKSDGTGMFQTIKEAVDSITNANHLTNPFVIEVYPGTYDCLEGFTDEEIASADEGGGYDQDTMVGIKLTDGISIRGVGRCDDIILTAELSTTDWSSGVRWNISTLNLQGEGNLENVTVIGKNIRYCVHDDFGCPINSHDKRIVRNCKFKGSNLAYSPLYTTYGAGMTAPRDYLIENCDFGFDLGIHSNSGFAFGCTIEVANCSGTRFRVGDNATSAGDAVNRVIVNQCNFQEINISHTSTNFPTHMNVEGVGCGETMIHDVGENLYRFGMIDLAPTGLSTGKMVKRQSTGLGFETTNDKAKAHGVVIGSDTDFSYVQKCGYIPSNYLNLSGLSLGDYVTVDNSGSVVTGGTASNAIGVVSAVDSDGNAHIKMLI